MMHNENVQIEMLVPPDDVTSDRLEGFYRGIGWMTTFLPKEGLISAEPALPDSESAPRVVYRQVKGNDYTSRFVWNEEDEPSAYAVGLRLPAMQYMVSVGLLLASSRDVEVVWRTGGQLLERHAHVPLDIAHGRRRFFFNDPFNYSFQVTSSVGDVGIAHAVDVSSPDPGMEK